MSEFGEDYDRRLNRVKDAIALKEPDRVPLIPVMQAFPVYYAGMTVEEAMHDPEKAGEAYDRFFEDFKPDLGWDPINMFPAPAMEAVDLRWARWPGNELGPNEIFQFKEGEYMKADEYDELLYDPTHFIMTRWIPRSFGNLSSFKNLVLRNSPWMGWLSTFLPFASEEFQEDLEKLVEAAENLQDWFGFLANYDEKMKRNGIPVAYGAFSFAPFDILGDSLRGTKGVLKDLYRRPGKVREAAKKLTPIAIDMGVQGVKASGNPFVWIWLHKGVDEFMSSEHFEDFYWPSLKNLLLGLIEEDIVPVVYVEGSYNKRLEVIREVPEGKLIYHFENTDMVKAKEMLSDVACIAGNVSNSLLTTGSPDDIKEKCRALIDDVARGGGYMMSSGALIDNAKPENMKAMFEVTKEYGVY